MKKTFIALIVLLSFSSCKTPEARKPVTISSGSFIDESVERNKKLNEKEYDLIQNIIKENPETNFIASQNGFWYYYNTKIEDSLATPIFGDLVNFNYDVKDLKGKTIYSQEELKTKTYAMDQEELFSGLREGLKLMKTGETVTFLFPSQKAYGYYGDENKIGNNIPIICTVTVNSITQKETN